MKFSDSAVIVAREETGYPERLSQISGPPAQLYIAGDPAVLNEPIVAVVGTRRCTPEGRQAAFDLSAALARRGVVIVSGLAYGIDAAAHEGALFAGGKTVAVLAAGLSRIYPHEHQELAERIAAQGALVSEFLLNEFDQPFLFPRRNRIIAGLSLGVVVVEAPRKSGAMITARLALEENRSTFAVPGSIFNPAAAGTNALVRDTAAKLVQNVDDILSDIRELSHLAGAALPSVERGEISPEAGTLLEALGTLPRTVDDLTLSLGLPPASLIGLLTALELSGRVRQLPGLGFVKS